MKLKTFIGVAFVFVTLFTGCTNDEFEPQTFYNEGYGGTDVTQNASLVGRWGIAGRTDANGKIVPLFEITGNEDGGNIIWYENYVPYIGSGTEQLNLSAPYTPVRYAQGEWKKPVQQPPMGSVDGSSPEVNIEITFKEYWGESLALSYAEVIRYADNYRRTVQESNVNISSFTSYFSDGENRWYPQTPVPTSSTAVSTELTNWKIEHPLELLINWGLQRQGYTRTQEYVWYLDGLQYLTMPGDPDNPGSVHPKAVRYSVLNRDAVAQKKFNEMFNARQASYKIVGNTIDLRWEYKWETETQDSDEYGNPIYIDDNNDWSTRASIWCIKIDNEGNPL